ncbi:hypothetical protein [Zavarzinella formosa]|uniref:hypothetical protein n=1 Tax=Zavarzinella formosa TaxID=360055 RepID=UPI00031EFFDB|nr:hypothetical protein [Zavarzinella formosa]
MNLFAKARAWLGEQSKKAAGVAVVYVQKSSGIRLPLTPIPGRTVFTSNLEDRARVEFGDRDYLIEAVDLATGEPAIGDRVIETIDGATTTFEVMPTNTGEPAWRWSDPGHTRWRIHMKQVS